MPEFNVTTDHTVDIRVPENTRDSAELLIKSSMVEWIMRFPAGIFSVQEDRARMIEFAEALQRAGSKLERSLRVITVAPGNGELAARQILHVKRAGVSGEYTTKHYEIRGDGLTPHFIVPEESEGGVKVWKLYRAATPDTDPVFTARQDAEWDEVNGLITAKFGENIEIRRIV